jgi:hypothetical protein
MIAVESLLERSRRHRATAGETNGPVKLPVTLKDGTVLTKGVLDGITTNAVHPGTIATNNLFLSPLSAGSRPF